MHTATQEAANWLEDWLTSLGGTDESANIKRAGVAAGHHAEAIRRARTKLMLEVTSEGFPRKTFWSLPGSVVSTPGERVLPLRPLTQLTPLDPSRVSRVSHVSH